MAIRGRLRSPASPSLPLLGAAPSKPVDIQQPPSSRQPKQAEFSSWDTDSVTPVNTPTATEGQVQLLLLYILLSDSQICRNMALPHSLSHLTTPSPPSPTASHSHFQPKCLSSPTGLPLCWWPTTLAPNISTRGRAS